MATELHVRIRPNPYQGNEAVFWWNGMLNRYSFELRTELAIKLVDDCVPQHVIDSVMDSLDVFEWDQPEYPLGVVYVGDEVCDVPVDDPVYGNARPAVVEPSPFWVWLADTLHIGSRVAPWVLLIILGRMWGWV